MKQEDGYLLKKIADSYYILPYGQNIVDYRRSLKTNKTGAFLWNALEQECSHKELLSKFAAYCKADPEKIPEIEQDMNLFLKQLRIQHMIKGEKQSLSCGGRICHYLNIAGLILKITAPTPAFAAEFNAFLTSETETPDQTIEVYYDLPHEHPNGTLLLRNEQLIVCDIKEEYLLLFPASQNLSEAYLRKDGTHASFFCHCQNDTELAQDLFHAIRFVYLYLAQKRGLFALHSASILYQNHAWLFSGKSGEGKSTHTKLWNTLFQTPLINGDLNLISLNGTTPRIHGIPWCGTSKISDTATHPLGGIILLKQAKNDTCIALKEDEKQILITQRLISPAWTREQLQYNLDFVERLVKHIDVYRLLCTKNNSAVYTLKKQIDTAFCP